MLPPVDRDVTIQPPQVSNILGPGQPSLFASPDKQVPPPPDAEVTGPNELGGTPGRFCYFILKSNGKTIGPQLKGGSFGVQERWTLYYRIEHKEDDGPWRPNSTDPAVTDARDKGADSSFRFIQLGDNNWAIFDFKCFKSPTDQSGNPTPNFNKYFILYRQSNRMSWIDNTNETVYGDPIGTKDRRLDGNGDGTWTATISDPPPAPTNP